MDKNNFFKKDALGEQIAADKARYLKYKLLYPMAGTATIKELLVWLE